MSISRCFSSLGMVFIASVFVQDKTLMKYLLLTIPALAFEVSIAVASPVRAVAASHVATKTIVETQPEKSNIQKADYFQRIKIFVKSVISSLVSKPSKGLLIVLAILVPWLAVGLAIDWELKHVIINLLLGMFTCLGGIIHAIIIVNKHA